MTARPRRAKASADPFGFFATTAPGAVPRDMPSLDELADRLVPASMRAEMPPPPPPEYPPIRGTGYRIPVIRPLEPLVPSPRGMRELPTGPGQPALGSNYDPATVHRSAAGRADGTGAPDEGAAARIGSAATRAVGALFDPPFGIARESLGPLVSQTPEEMRGPGGLLRTFNDVLIRGGSQALDVTGRAALAPIVGGIAALTQTLREAGMSRTDARKLERDLYGITVSVGAVTGTTLGRVPRVPRADRVYTEAKARGTLDLAIAKLPREARAAVTEKLRDAFREGERAGAKAAEGKAPGARQRVIRRAAAAEPKAKPPLKELPAVSRTVNPMTATEFERLPSSGTVDASRIRTMQEGASRFFKIDPVTGKRPRVIDMTNQLRANPSYAQDVPPVRIFSDGNGVFTLDHRRLVAHRLAGVPIRYRKASDEEIGIGLILKKDREARDGLSIRIRTGKRSK